MSYTNPQKTFALLMCEKLSTTLQTPEFKQHVNYDTSERKRFI